jgi:hypothetical protein
MAALMMAKRSTSLYADYIPIIISSTLVMRVTMSPSGRNFLGAGSVDASWSLVVVVSGFATAATATATAAYVLLDVTTSGTRLHPAGTWGPESYFICYED